jgi:hypothetical protein
MALPAQCGSLENVGVFRAVQGTLCLGPLQLENKCRSVARDSVYLKLFKFQIKIGRSGSDMEPLDRQLEAS